MKLYTVSEISNLSGYTAQKIYADIRRKEIEPYCNESEIMYFTDFQMYRILGVVVKEIEKTEIIKVTQNWLIIESKINKL